MSQLSPRRVVIIGGGAAGLFAAITAGRGGADVTVLEKANRVGKKLLKTGNGRCNLSNLAVSPQDYNHPDFAAPLLSEWGAEALLREFSALGLLTVSDSEGRVYPRSDTAASVLDVLRLSAAALGVREVCSAEVERVLLREDGSYLVCTRECGSFPAERVIVASGGGTQLVKPLGHRTVPFSPILCPLKTDPGAIRGLSGLRVRCAVRLLCKGKTVAEECGEVLFRDFGVSGIVILNMSRHAREGMTLSLDLLPELSEEALHSLLLSRPHGGSELLTGIFHRRVAEALLRLCPGGDAAALAHTIKHFGLTVLGCADTQNAQVTRGGADTAFFDPLTLESRICPGLYVVGEALDMDGRCGGFNLHWAFISGMAAGRSATE